ncbi:MAG TPA: DUF3616 domain-containing protein [Bosea sp. (in: a-proteobacteria)]
MLLLSLSCSLGGAAEPPALKPTSGPLDAGNGFAFANEEKKTRRSLSGIACPAASKAPGLCLAVFDEGGEARYLTIDGGALRPDAERVVLIPGQIELDGEAAATDGTFYYVAGSHSAKRSDCKTNRQSRHLIRFKVDPDTGRAKRDGADKLADFTDTGALWTLMGGFRPLKAYVGDGMCLGTKPPGKNGVNIEGMAARDGRLFFGFRGPVGKDGAKILSVNAKALFEGGDADPKLFTVALEKGRSVRDLLAVSDGILMLAGPDDNEANEKLSFTVSRWNGKEGKENVKPLARLDLSGVKLRDCDKETKPEAIAVLGEKPGQPYEAVIFSDGMCDGGALRFSIPR